MAVRLGGDYGKLQPIDLAIICLTLVMLVGAWQIGELREDRAEDRRLIAELIEHEVEQARMLCDAGVSEAEGCKEDGDG